MPIEPTPQASAAPAPHAAHHGVADHLGIGVSLTCAVHCAATGALSVVPSLFSFGRVGSSELTEVLEQIELPMLVLALLFGLYSLVPSYRNEHQNPLPLGVFLGGLALLFVSRMVEGPAEIAVTVSGVFLIATGHLLNIRAHSRVHRASCAVSARAGRP